MIDNLTLIAVDPWWVTALRIAAVVAIIAGTAIPIRHIIEWHRYRD